MNEWGARASNSLAAIALVLVIYAFAYRPLGRRGAFLAALMLGSSTMFMILARYALTDMWLAFWLTACLGALFRAVESRREGSSGTGWFLFSCLLSGLAMLTKGAVGIVLPAGAAFFYLVTTRQLRSALRLSWLVPGTVIVLGVGLSWYLLLGFTHEDGFAFMQKLFMDHHVGRFTQPMQGHQGPIFYYLPVLLLGFLPWSPFLVQAFLRGRLRGASEERTRFLRLFTIFGGLTLAFFSVAATKLPNYVLPVIPSLALLTANLWERQRERETWSRGWAWSAGVTAALLFLAAAFLAALPYVVSRLPDILGEKAVKVPALAEPISLGAGPYLAAAVLLAGAAALVASVRRRNLAAMAASCTGATTGFLLVAILTLAPVYDRHFLAPLREMARRAADETEKDERVVMLGIRHAITVTYYGGRYRRYQSVDQPKRLTKILTSPEREIGIVARGNLAKLEGRGRLEVLAERGGYVLVRMGGD